MANRDAIERFMSTTADHYGFFDNGTPSVSLLSPGLARMIADLSLISGVKLTDQPRIFRLSFSTTELDSLFVGRGYMAHLQALTVLLGMEIADLRDAGGSRRARAANLRLGTAPRDLRTRHLSRQLTDLDPGNLFFRFLWMKSSGALTDQRTADLAEELLTMPFFPAEGSPDACKRGADYLWQRDSATWSSVSSGDCGARIYPGVDFLWMASLLFERLDGRVSRMALSQPSSPVPPSSPSE